MSMETEKSKLVFDMRACRMLLKKGFKVIDCKPLKTDREKTVLVFADTPEFEKTLEIVMEELKAKDELKRHPKLECEQLSIEGWD